ncbi:hypothetical protein L7F22_004787 [Adiantum nelumboides]|nr:hypothetical protein [Adiantum nelumboides]
MKAEEKVWFNTLLPANRGDCAELRVLFLAKFGGGGETSESLWGKVCELRQGSLFEYNVYEVQFVELWERWVASLRLGEATPDFLKKDRFVAGLCPPLIEKVKGRFPVTWMDARDIARLKERKIRYQLQQRKADQEEEGMAPVPPSRTSLDAKVKAKEEERGKSLPKDKVEDVDAMSTKRARQEEAAMSETGERRKSKENEESSSKKKSKPRREWSLSVVIEATALKIFPPQRKLTIKDFALGESSQPYNLVDDVSVQGPKITWPQLLHLAPKVRRQWTKMARTRRVKTKAMGLVSGRNLQDITPVLNAYVKGQRVSNVYVDGGAQICVITEQTMHRLGLKVNAPAPCKAKMANNSKVKCLGVINALKIKVCEIEAEVDVYVMPTKGEGYPIILGRPWLMAMQARQDWGTGMLELQPHKGAKKGKAIHIDLRGGKHESLDLETSVDEFSSFDYSTSEEESTITDESDSSQAQIMGVVLTNPTMVSSINVPQVEEGKLAKMLAKDLTQDERQAYLAMLEGYPRLFIDGYDQITGVSVVQHHIILKDEAKPVVQRLRRLGVIQQDALLSEIRKLLNAELQEYEYTFIVEDSRRASLADVLTYKVKEKKITPKAQVKLDLSPQGELEDAYTLLFDGAYHRQRNKAAGGFVILNEEKKEVLKKGIQLHLAHSNNEAEYATLKAGLEECKSMGIKRLMVKGDALLIVRHVQGTWACKISKLLQWLHEVKLLMKNFKAIQIQHILRQHNKEADNMANSQFEMMVGAIKFKEPLFQGQETMDDILYFLETGECPKHLERVQRHRLVRKALSYQLIGEHLYHKGKDLVLRRVPLVKEIEKILMSCHDGVCGGHFAQEITSRKILQAGFVWPSLHRDVQHWCKACKACQQAGDRKLSYGPRFPIFAYGPFEKWGIDAIGPLPCTSTSKQCILTATDYMTRWAKAASVARITVADVSKFMLDYIYSRFGTPLEILSDRGRGFRANLLDALLEKLSIKHVHSTPYYPQCNGLVEKTNGVLCQEALLPIEVELGSLRVLAKETTSSKEKLEQRILDLQRLELDREAAIDYYITQANKKREQFNSKVKEKKLEEGMLVMRYDSRLDLSHSKKFLQRWEDPYVIFKKFKNGSYRLQDLSGKIHKYRVNEWRLKEFFQCIQPIKEERQVSLDA